MLINLHRHAIARCGFGLLFILFIHLATKPGQHTAHADELPPLGDDVPVELAEEVSPFRYQWNDERVYSYEIEAELTPRPSKIGGRCTLQPTNKTLPQEQTDDAKSNGTGSGFVVHPQGVIVTCAHVVKGATQVVVHVEDAEQKATVIGLNADQDIAFLRINANDLSYLPVADSDRVGLATEVRALGYPLTDVLGKSVKVNRGEISGIGTPQSEKALQFDASVNPGNSGGPLIDRSGRVVGVASSLLGGAGISEIGFAVPSNTVRGMAHEMNIPLAVSNEATGESTVEVVSHAAAATVFIECEYGLDGVGIDTPQVLSHSGFWYGHSGGSFIGASNTNRMKNGLLAVDRVGQVLEVSNDLPLPFMLGSGAAIGIETLPGKAGTTVSSSQPVVVQQSERQTNPLSGLLDFRSRYRMAPWSRGSPQAEQTTITRYKGTETTTWKITEVDGANVEISRAYSLNVSGKSDDDRPYLTMKGSGTGKFNNEEGRMESMEYEAELTLNQDNVSVRVPLTMKYRYRDPAELKRVQEEADKRRRMRAETTPSEPREPTKADFDPVESTSSNEAQFKIPSVQDIPTSSRLDQFDPDK